MAEEQQKMVGARAKIARAQQLKSQGFYIQQEKNRKKKTSRAVVIAVFYAVSYAYAFLMLDAIENQFPQLMQMIRLTGDAQEIDCRHDGIKGLVLRAEFVRKR